jgi:hypothetical protein
VTVSLPGRSVEFAVCVVCIARLFERSSLLSGCATNRQQTVRAAEKWLAEFEIILGTNIDPRRSRARAKGCNHVT